MTNTIDARLAELGIALPSPAAPLANYVPYVEMHGLIHVSGQIPIDADGIQYVGRCGETMDVETAQAAARLCGINVLAQVKSAAGRLEAVRAVKLNGFVNSTPDFGEQPTVINAVSDLMVAVLGDNGRHARSAVGVANLPFGVAVEVDAVFARI